MPAQPVHSPAAPPRVTRRGLMAGGVALAGAAALPPTAAPATLAFQVTRNGSPIGTHTLTFERRDGTLRVRIAAEFRVGFGFITLFRYRHQALEQWQDGQFTTLDSATNSNGRLFHVHAARTGAGIAVQASALADQTLPGAALPLTHWAQAAMHAPLFNPQTGEMMPETARAAGAGMVKSASGRPIAATHYTLAGITPMEDWYDSAGLWAALDATASDGSVIAYRRV